MPNDELPGDMQLRDELWAKEVTNPKGVVGRAAKLEDKILLDTQNGSIENILKALRFVGRFEGAIQLLEKLESEGIALKVAHYNSAIKACGEMGNWEAAGF